eukprot:TRINITY_DN11395_c0_g1_i2.p1 TRINITY_DN11395_c0_g1~~TRINITY_DN11395_c0_g1_i2.p1  ORF type:complete len:136 (-),score=6.95 TRINITY_DN11395_c0_g1_i2:2-409(-)
MITSNRHWFLERNLIGIKNAYNNRPICYLKNDSRNTTVQCTAVVMFCDPRRCQEKLSTGSFCYRRHKTVQEFAEFHTKYTENQVHISHLCHDSRCLNPEHLIIESSTTNLRRNNCRKECRCGGVPQCYSFSRCNT